MINIIESVNLCFWFKTVLNMYCFILKKSNDTVCLASKSRFSERRVTIPSNFVCDDELINYRRILPNFSKC